MRAIKSAFIIPSLSYILYIVLFPGFVIFSEFSDNLIFGVKVPSSFITAASLYTPPNAGLSFDVIRLVPTPQEVIAAPCVLRESIRYSSRSLEADIIASGKPASSNIRRAFLERYARSPESRRIP